MDIRVYPNFQVKLFGLLKVWVFSNKTRSHADQSEYPKVHVP
jgi:hypothetical protein